MTTFGCQMNARDSEKLLGILKDIGYEESDNEENADFVIYNTCTVRENANLRVYGRLGQLKKAKRNNHEMIIAMCGCMMQEPEVGISVFQQCLEEVAVAHITGCQAVVMRMNVIYQMLEICWTSCDSGIKNT